MTKKKLTWEEEVDQILAEIEQGKHNRTLFMAQAHVPYDGCWWEWVYAFIHENKIWWAKDPRSYKSYKWRKDDSDREVLLNLTDHKFVRDFKEHVPGAAVRGLLDYAESLEMDWFAYPCSSCGEPLWSQEVYYPESDYRSEGGVSWVAGEPVCSSCMDLLERPWITSEWWDKFRQLQDDEIEYNDTFLVPLYKLWEISGEWNEDLRYMIEEIEEEAEARNIEIVHHFYQKETEWGWRDVDERRSWIFIKR